MSRRHLLILFICGAGIMLLGLNALNDYYTLVFRCEHQIYRGEPYNDEARCNPVPRDEAEGSSGQSETRESQWVLTANVSDTANVSVHDSNIEPNWVYIYAARVFVSDKASDYIPRLD